MKLCDFDWATAAIGSLVDICCLNMFTVEAGLFPMYLKDMNETDLKRYLRFLEDLKDAQDNGKSLKELT